MRRGALDSPYARRAMAPGGCLLVLLGLAAFTALLAAFSGYFFYRNFGQKLWQVRDEVQPVGEKFIRSLDDQNYRLAYSLLSSQAQEDWPAEKFGPWAKDLHQSLGRLLEFSVLAQPTVDFVTQNKQTELNNVPMYFPCKYVDGGKSFILTFHRHDGVWLIDKIRLAEVGKEIGLIPSDRQEPAPPPTPIESKPSVPADELPSK
jgi:hypothetical protein